MAEQLTQQQKEAVENRGGMLLVSAAAGSGKTKVLVDRLLSYITDPVAPANIDDFLIITYTKAAAAELRGKIAQKLSEAIAAEPENRHLQQQMQRLYLAKISTVHAFCADILRENVYRMDIAPDFRVADENECRQLQETVIEQLLESIYDSIHEDSELQAFIDNQGFGRDDRQIQQILLQVYHSAMCHLSPDAWLQWCLRQTCTENFSDVSETVWGKYLIDQLHSHLQLQIQALNACVEAANRNDTLTSVGALLTDTVSQLEKLKSCTLWDDIIANSQIDYGRLTFPKNCADTQLAEQIKAVRNACKNEVGKKLRPFTDCSQQILRDLEASSVAVRGLVRLVKQFWQMYDGAKKKRRILDFADLEHKMLDLLLGKARSAPTTAAKEISQRFREIMVDEYQDSNSVQDAIFFALTQQRNNCFMVGDVKQSIYQFRLADPRIFIEKYNAYESAENARDGQGRKVLLSKNFRSSGGVIDAVNAVFSRCMSPEVGGLDYTDDEMLYEGVPHIPLEDTEVELYGIRVEEDTYAEESSFVADRICAMLDGKHMIRKGDELRPITPEDIVILLRSPGSVGADFQLALETRGIRCVTGDSADILKTEEVAVLIAFLQVISNPLQDIPLVAILTSRIFGFTADEVANIRGNHRKGAIYDALKADKSEKCVKFLQILNRLRQDSRVYRLSELLERVVLQAGFYSVYGAMDNGGVRCENIQTICQVASDFASGGERDLQQLLEYFASMEERGLLLTGQSSAEKAVTIMSIHKSKGLEFPVVFLCGLSRAFNQESTRATVLCDKELGLGLNCIDHAQRVRYSTVAKRAIAAKMIAEGVSEELRVLYVAMTRAKDRLIMTYAKKNLEKDLQEVALRLPNSPNLLLTSQAGCAGDWILLGAMCRSEAGEFFAVGGNPCCAAVSDSPWKIAVVDSQLKTLTGLPDQQEMPEDHTGDILRMKEFLSYRYPHLAATKLPSKQTATQLHGRPKDQEIAENTWKGSAVSNKFRKPAFYKAQTNALERGTAVHTFMQFVDYKRCIDAAAIAQERDRLVSQNLLTQTQAAMIVPEEIAAFFASDLGRRLQESENVLREFKFSIMVDAQTYYPGVSNEQILLQGVVDCALVEEDGITVIDFKTDRVTAETVDEIAAGYRLQVITYTQALERIYKRPVKESYLYFVRLGTFVKV